MIYAASISELHLMGGMPFMTPLTLMLLINAILVVLILINILQKKAVASSRLETIRQIGGLAAAWGVLSTIIGLFAAFEALESSAEVLPFQVIMGGLKVGVITAIYGLIIYCLSLTAYIVLKVTSAKESANS